MLTTKIREINSELSFHDYNNIGNFNCHNYFPFWGWGPVGGGGDLLLRMTCVSKGRYTIYCKDRDPPPLP